MRSAVYFIKNIMFLIFKIKILKNVVKIQCFTQAILCNITKNILSYALPTNVKYLFSHIGLVVTK